MKKYNIGQATIIALFFGGFQMLMPFIGWAIGIQFSGYIDSFDHWIALGLLLFLGVKMIIDSFKKDEHEGEEKLGITTLIVMAIATSIDAFAVGVTFSFEQMNILASVALIGAITFALCLVGTFCGFKIGSKLSNKAEIIGGVILILIGVKIVLNAYGILPF